MVKGNCTVGYAVKIEMAMNKRGNLKCKCGGYVGVSDVKPAKETDEDNQIHLSLSCTKCRWQIEVAMPYKVSLIDLVEGVTK